MKRFKVIYTNGSATMVEAKSLAEAKRTAISVKDQNTGSDRKIKSITLKEY